MANQNKNRVRELLTEMDAPPEAMDAFPDECANCGAPATPFFVPNDYHEKEPHERDPGLCTECAHHFGTGNRNV